jgi:hypothetical protein
MVPLYKWTKEQAASLFLRSIYDKWWIRAREGRAVENVIFISAQKRGSRRRRPITVTAPVTLR